jgi:hypothetical protein
MISLHIESIAMHVDSQKKKKKKKKISLKTNGQRCCNDKHKASDYLMIENSITV